MNGTNEKKIVSTDSVEKRVSCKPIRVTTELDEKIRDFKSGLKELGDDVLYECFIEIIKLLFRCTPHTAYTVLFKALGEEERRD